MSLPVEYERQIAKKRIPGILRSIAAAENRAALLPEAKARAERDRAERLRRLVAELLALMGPDEPTASREGSRQKAAADRAPARSESTVALDAQTGVEAKAVEGEAAEVTANQAPSLAPTARQIGRARVGFDQRAARGATEAVVRPGLPSIPQATG